MDLSTTRCVPLRGHRDDIGKENGKCKCPRPAGVGKCVILGTPLSGYLLLQPTWQITLGGEVRILVLGCHNVIGHM